MDENNINNNQPMDPNRPRLIKKVKRPIKRLVPKAPNSPFLTDGKQATEDKGPTPPVRDNPFAKMNSGSASQAPKMSDDDFDLDSFLDEPETLPTKVEAKSFLEERPKFLGEENLPSRESKIDLKEADDEYNSDEAKAHSDANILVLSKKIAIIAFVGLFFLGFIISKLFFTEQKIVRNGLQGVVINPEVPRGRARCGVAERTQGCVLYIMNPQRQELNARDFYDLASQLTGRQRFVIETGNMRYSNTKIRPGDIGQFNIPPL